MMTDLTVSDLKRMLKLSEVSQRVCIIKSDMAGRFKYINEAGSNLFEIKNVDFEIKNLFADADEWEFLKHKLKRDHICKDLIYLLKSTSNKNFWTNISIEITGDGDIYWVLKDISSAQKQQQEIEYQRVLLKKLKNELDQIIYSASHGLRSPITSILGLLNLLNLARSKQEKNEYIFLIQSSVVKLDALVQNLGRISQNSNETVKDQKIDFDHLFNTTKNDLSFHPNFQKIKLKKTLAQKHLFYSDFERIKKVMTNILKNCLDFIDINKSHIFAHIEIVCSDRKVVITIFDNGIGISKSNINHVFDLYYRGTDRSKGEGLGLFESKEIIIKLGGTIKLNSEYKIGTCVEIEIPNSKKGKLLNKKNALRLK